MLCVTGVYLRDVTNMIFFNFECEWSEHLLFFVDKEERVETHFIALQGFNGCETEIFWDQICEDFFFQSVCVQDIFAFLSPAYEIFRQL